MADLGALAVKDTGMGIPLDEQQQIFEHFYRVDSDRSRKTGGTGLGLAIAQAIAQRHNAEIIVDSHPHRGSCFSTHLKNG